MSQEKDWKVMLAELQAEMQLVDDKNKAAYQRSRDVWIRLDDIFNDSAAREPIFFPRLLPRSKRAYQNLLVQAGQLRDEIFSKLNHGELTNSEVCRIYCDARDVRDKMLFREKDLNDILKQIVNTTYDAYEAGKEKDSSLRGAWSAEVDQKGLAVFERYLDQNPEVVPVLYAMRYGERGAVEHINTISKRLGKIVTPVQLKDLIREVDSILEGVNGISSFTVLDVLKDEFRGLLKADLRDEHYNWYIGMGGRQETRDAIMKRLPAASKDSGPDTPKL